MATPRLEIDLIKIEDNARKLIGRLARRGIVVTGVTKAALGSPEIAGAFLRAGAERLGDSRIENIETMRHAGMRGAMTLIRSPIPSQTAQVVRCADASFNTELDIIAMLSDDARKARRTHEVIIMVELGDLREGVMPGDLESFVRQAIVLPNISLKGIGANLGCQNGVCPDTENMAELSRLATAIERTFDLKLDTISGGNSSNLHWALGDNVAGKINDLRLGEAILLGRDPLWRQPIKGLHTDAVSLVAEVIEAKTKPSKPWGEFASATFEELSPITDKGPMSRVILAIGHQDTDPKGLVPPEGMEIIGAGSDHLVLDSGRHRLSIGAEVKIQVDYSALLRAMTSPFVAKNWRPRINQEHSTSRFQTTEFNPVGVAVESVSHAY